MAFEKSIFEIVFLSVPKAEVRRAENPEKMTEAARAE